MEQYNLMAVNSAEGGQHTYFSAKDWSSSLIDYVVVPQSRWYAKEFLAPLVYYRSASKLQLGESSQED